MTSPPTTCLFTGAPATLAIASGQDFRIYESEACGRYAVPNDCVLSFPKVEEVGIQNLVNCAKHSLDVCRTSKKIPLWVRRTYAARTTQQLGSDQRWQMCVFEDHLDQPVDHSQKPMVLLRILAENLLTKSPFTKVQFSKEDCIRAGICDEQEFVTLVQHLGNHDLIHHEQITRVQKGWMPPPSLLGIQMTVPGWAELRRKAEGSLSNQVFIATKFKWTEGEETLRLEVMQAIKEACADCGYDAQVVSQNHTGFITDRIISEIRRARFVVAELTYNNRGVYFESGLARGLEIPVFHVIHKDHVSGGEAEGKKIHFDIEQIRHLKWDKPSALKIELRDWILATLGRFGHPGNPD